MTAARLDYTRLLSTIMLVSNSTRRFLFQASCLRSRSLAARGYVIQPRSGLDEGELNIHNKLNDRFDPVELDVQDVSGAPIYCAYIRIKR